MVAYNHIDEALYYCEGCDMSLLQTESDTLECCGAPAGEPEIDYDNLAFYDHLEDFVAQCQDRWPSLQPCDKWLGSEDHAVLENGHAYFGISEYCNMLAYWVVPKDDEDNLAAHWCASIERGFINTFGRLTKIGTFSNGESVYRLSNRRA